jgi:hypothetical protein
MLKQAKAAADFKRFPNAISSSPFARSRMGVSENSIVAVGRYTGPQRRPKSSSGNPSSQFATKWLASAPNFVSHEG